MLPPRTGRDPVTSQEPKITRSFRLPKSIDTYLQTCREFGYEKTEVVIMSIELLRDISEAMDNEWWEIGKIAGKASQSRGTTIGKLALEALKSRAQKK